MRNYYSAICISIVLLIALLYGSATQTIDEANDRVSLPTNVIFGTVTFDFSGDVNDVTEDADNEIEGYLDDIVIDSNGTDTSYKIYVKDEHGVAVYSKTDCNSAVEPYHYAISSNDGTNYFRGVAVSGIIQVQIADCNDSSMDDLDVTIYYRDYRKW